jgi:hypothetical protein
MVVRKIWQQLVEPQEVTEDVVDSTAAKNSLHAVDLKLSRAEASEPGHDLCEKVGSRHLRNDQ